MDQLFAVSRGVVMFAAPFLLLALLQASDSGIVRSADSLPKPKAITGAVADTTLALLSPLAPIDSGRAAVDTVQSRRPRAAAYSDAYSTRLTTHRRASYSML